MIKIRTIITRGKNQDIKSAQFETLPSFEDLKTHFLKQVPWRNIEIKFDDVQRDEICVVDSEESLERVCQGKLLLSFFVCPFRRKMYKEEWQGLVREGFPKVMCGRLLRRFKGDVELVRSALRAENMESEEVRVLGEEGVTRKVAVRLMKRFGDVGLARDHFLKKRAITGLYSDIADRLYGEGYQHKRRCMFLLSKFNGDVNKVKKIMDKKNKRKREKTPKELKSSERKEKRKRKRSIKIIDVTEDFLTLPDGSSYALESSPEFFVEKIGRVYLDGNNMLYIEKEMRNLSIKGRTKIQAEKMLGNIALSFTQALNFRKDNFQMNLMFDSSSMHGTTDTNFEIVSGKVMGFSTADDALVSLSYEFNESELLSDTLFVTSDVELQNRLAERGAIIMKSKAFLKCAEVLIGEEIYQTILQQQTTQI